jgi:hypothetical protein
MDSAVLSCKLTEEKDNWLKFRETDFLETKEFIDQKSEKTLSIPDILAQIQIKS